MQHDPNLPDPANFRVRSADRTEAAIACVIARPEQPDMDGEIQNFSPGGALLVSAEPLAVDAFLTLRFGDLEPVSAQVRWTDGEKSGCRFVRTLTVRQYLRIRQGADFEAPIEAETPSFMDKLRRLLPSRG